MDEKILGKRISELRKKRNLSQSDLADLISMSTSTIAMWEVGRRDPDTKMVAKLSDIFGVSTDYLLGQSNDPLINDHLSEEKEGDQEAVIKTIQRAARNMSSEDQERMLQMMKLAFEKAFSEDD